jgi:hypothetical protein
MGDDEQIPAVTKDVPHIVADMAIAAVLGR